MDAIEKIIAQIDEQAASERAVYEKNEETRIDQEFTEKMALLKEQKNEQLTKQLDALDKKYRQLKNRQQVEVRQETLNLKQRYLTQLFQSAAEKMSQWTASEQQDFAKQALQKLPLTGEKKFIAGEKSQGAFSQEFLTEISRELPFTLVLSEDVLKDQAGFVVDDEGVQYNFIYLNLVQDQQQAMSFDLAKKLFE